MIFGLSISMAQSATSDLTAAEIFEKVINYYDPDGIWNHYKGSMRVTSIWPNSIYAEEITIDNASGFYRCLVKIKDNDQAFVRGMKNGEPFFKIGEREMLAVEVPEEFQKAPYNVNEHFAKMGKEHHAFHFSGPLSLKAAGAKPIAEVKKETIFGTECLALKFSGLPNNYEKGGYNGPITLYVNPADNYKLHAVLHDNSWWTDQKGMISLYSGEIEVAGLKVPARRLFFHAANNSYGFIDVFETISDQDH